MSTSTSSTSSSGIGFGFAGVLTLILITLKLLGKIDWSWWWVLSPIWISIVGAVVIIAAVLAGWVVIEVARIHGRRNRR